MSNQSYRVEFPANHGGVSKCIRPLMLLCHTNIQVRRPSLIREIKKETNNIKVSPRVSQGVETINERESTSYQILLVQDRLCKSTPLWSKRLHSIDFSLKEDGM